MEKTLLKRTRKVDRLLLTMAGLVLGVVVLVVAPMMFARSEQTGPAPSIGAYRGLGSWVDIYDKRAWADPAAAVKDMASHGVLTVYVQTGNSTQKRAVFDPSGQEAFILAAHARGMKVVAWYLPDMVNVAYDYERVAQAVGFRTSDGQRFDSFALDIESTAIADEQARNVALAALSRRIRDRVGTGYPLGAIIPSPVSLAKKAGHWDAFPYGAVAKVYDVFLPMGYYTYDGRGASVAESDTLGNVRILRAQPGCASVPVHLVGGLAHKSTSAAVEAFANATQKSGCIGGSLYAWAATTGADWKALRVIGR